MPADRLLNTVLQYYQDVHDDAKTEQIIGTTTHLLTQLSNPLNLGVLTSQLLTAPAYWLRPNAGLPNALRIISIFNTAAIRVREFEIESLEKRAIPPGREGGGLRCDEWTRAVVKGADDRSSRWQHLLVLTGVLMGMEGNDRQSLSRSLRNTLEQAVVTAANLALQTHAEDGPLAEGAVVMSLNYAFPLLSDHYKMQLNCDILLPMIVFAMVGDEGFADGRFLIGISQNTAETLGQGGLSWPVQSPSYQAVLELDKRPIMSNMGPLAKLAAFAAQHATNTATVIQAQDDLLIFTHRVLDAWAKNRLSNVDPAAEAMRLSAETLQHSWPTLWQVLRKLMFGVVAVLQAVTSRSLVDPMMLHDAVSSTVATKTLQILRNLYFISSRNGNSAFQVYTFTYLTSIDILCRNGAACENFLAQFRPADSISLPAQHLQRTLDLYYLNLAEHMPLSLSTDACDALIVKPAIAYLAQEGPMTPAVVEIFESAHSAVLSVLSCPQHSRLTIEMAPFYIVKLFESFPHHISPRQFRVAFKTVIQMVSPPFPIAAMEPTLSETLLEMLLSYTAAASIEPLPPPSDAVSQAASEESGEELMSAQSALVLALIDALPFLPLPLVEEWLGVAAQTMNQIADPRLRRPAKDRFWGILVNGEMDVERSAVGVAWWGTKGGRELVLYGGAVEPPMMSGAIVSEETQSRL
ncbi:hypothetical protein K4F52_002989 [Lecanicillium sp. MT-2017a]|nr:hypothetical protein K4F52_002989 [Lecanicillium sp. MT-2017a]